MTIGRRGRLPSAGALAVFAALALGACAAAPPVLRLAPASLGAGLALQQRLTVTMAGRPVVLDTVLEADALHLRLAVLRLGLTVARLDWDGADLRVWHDPRWPAGLPAGQVLSDLQLVLWPAAPIRAALPPGWRLEDDGRVRELLRGDTVQARVEYLSPGLARLSSPPQGYRIDIDSRPPEEPQP